jgi:hypothetical protein
MRPHRLRASWLASQRRQRDERAATVRRKGEIRHAEHSGYLRGHREKQKEFTRFVAPQRGVVFLQQPPDRDMIAVPIPEQQPCFSGAPVSPSAVMAVMYFRAKRMRCEVGNGVFADYFTWEPDRVVTKQSEVHT